MKIISSKRFIKKRYREWPFAGCFADSFGCPEISSRWLVYGASGQGKTEFCVQLAAYFCQFAQVLYVSAEQGDSRSLQMAWERNALGQERRVRLACSATSQDLLTLLAGKRGAPKVIIIDSLDYLDIDAEKYKELHEKAGKRTLIFVSWAEGGRPKTGSGRAIEFMVDVKVSVKNYVAEARSRYGSILPYVIWEEEAKKYHAFLNRGRPPL